MKQGIDPPYSCTVGVCTTCRAKVSKGYLHMLEREGLSDKEIEQGYVLTCQSVPRSNEIELSYE
jgi:ring-1,2-phenylacetyl-CoA epoxidase subunit PaaE